MSASASSERFHTIVIRNDLPKIEKQYQAEKPMDLPEASYWIQHVVNDVGGGRWNSSMDSNRFKMQHMISNGAYTSSAYSHAVFQAYLSAYNSHEDIVLSPDDLWLMVAIYFAKYVNANAEKLRHLFVNHEGKVKLTIEQMQREPDWNAFLESMRIKIGENVKNDVVSLLTANYSTTGKVELMLSCATIMNTFKNYFDYGLVMTMCGIRKVHFLGTLDDWLLLRDKTKQLQSFTMHNDEFSTYVEGLLPVFNQFISTYQGNVDNKFWDKIFNVEHVGAGSGSRTMLTGWFLRLCYGLHQKKSCNIQEVKLNSIVTPVEFESEYTNEKKTCYVVGGFHGIESRDGWHKPVMSLAIVDDLSTITQRKP
ncbi:unnamed protein product [Rotaria socialis]|uniref:Uncharacterized protein n=2 Tax=Rotaria socialis TaxID=392032 RepID=A0A818C4H8_9BILA|nr:unnamed protein product [Rotaria socialis]CAF3475643.1 unnamed protein product [Rotaria socialis]